MVSIDIENLTGVVKGSIESALTPALLFLAACRIVCKLGWCCSGGCWCGVASRVAALCQSTAASVILLY